MNHQLYMGTWQPPGGQREARFAWAGLDPAFGLSRPYAMSGRLAILPVDGPVLFGSCGWFGTSHAALVAALDGAAGDAQADALLLDLHCPGGTTAGADDLDQAVQRFKKTGKRLYAIAHDMAHSLGYWFGCRADEFVGTHTSEVGSIGTLTMLYDESGHFTAQGIKAVPISTGNEKPIGRPGVPITPEMIATQKAVTDRLQERFTSAVVEGRKVSAAEVLNMQAAIFAAPDAVGKKLLDRVVSFVPYLNELQSRHAAKTPGAKPVATRGAIARRNQKGSPMNFDAWKAKHAGKGLTDDEMQCLYDDAVAPDEEKPKEEEPKEEKKAETAAPPKVAASAPASIPATAAELKAAGIDGEYGFQCLAESKSLTDSLAGFIAHQKTQIAALAAKPADKPEAKAEKAKGPSFAPLGVVGGAKAGEPTTYAEAVMAIEKRDKIKREPAMAKAQKEHPALHAAWREDGYPAIQ